MKAKNYPLYKIDQVDNLKMLISMVSDKFGDSSAFIFEKNGAVVSISYRQLKRDIDLFGSVLCDLGVQNEAVSVIGENSYEWILSYFAVTNSGNVIVPLDRELPVADVRNLIDYSNAKVLIYSDAYSDVAHYLQESGARIQHYINMKTIPVLIQNKNALISQGECKLLDFEVDSNKMAALLYTSGTTGAAKGVMLSHFGLIHDAIAATQYVGIFGNNMLVLPLHHSFGFTAGVCAMLLTGSEIAINSSLRNISKDMQKFKPYNMFLVPLFVETFYQKIWDTAKKNKKEGLLKSLIKLSNFLLKIKIDVRRILFKSVLASFGGNLNLIVAGGAPLDIKYVRGFRDIGINVLNGYGITECSPVVSVNRNKYYRDGSIGLVLPVCEVKIANPDENKHGEIYVKGNIVMLGYYQNDKATKESFEGEWFKTGDIGYFDKDDFLYIVGRKKNLIVLKSGKNVYPEELELALLKQIEYIKEVVVYAMDDTIVAEIFLDVVNYPNCSSQLSGDILSFNQAQPMYKRICKPLIRETEFPKTTTKKIKRRYETEGNI
ncbi:MAG: AMP-binding protein [Candidatus Bathyarchaeota archaeon]|nr:AMP-binding protein [Candidatus Termiticorpusculum sp.]